MPSNCTIDNIASLIVSQDDEDDIDTSTEWEEHYFAGLNDSITSGVWYGHVPNGYFALTKNGKPIATSDLIVKIFYYKDPTTITAVTDTPELKSIYHDLLKYGLTQMLASQGWSLAGR